MTLPKGALPIAINSSFCLGSDSPRRRDLLAQIGVFPQQIIAAHIDETPLPRETPKHYAKRMAREKNQAIKAALPVLTADTVVCMGRKILPKAANDDMVGDCLYQLSGRNHRVYTAICLSDGAGIYHERLVETRLAMKRLSTPEIKRYIESKEGIGKAGGYAIQGLAAIFMRRIQGSYSNIVGLPLYETAQLLNGLGLADLDLIGERKHHGA